MTDLAYDGWELTESGPADARVTVLLLAGAMCPAWFFDDLMAEPALVHLRLVAATLPGFAGTPSPDDVSFDGTTAQAAALARRLGAAVVVGHSLGANHALEMVASGEFRGPVVLLSPSFSAEDEMKELHLLNKLGRLPGLGALLWMLAMKLLASGLGKSLPESRRAEIVARMPANDWRFCRAAVRGYVEHLDRGGLVERLCRAKAPAWVAFGDHDEVGLTEEERRELEACPSVTLIPPLSSTHFVMLLQPGRCAEIVLEAVAASEAP